MIQPPAVEQLLCGFPPNYIKRAPPGHKLSWVSFLETCSSVRRGEGGGEWLGGPLWSPAVPFHLVPLPMGPRLKTYPCKLGITDSIWLFIAIGCDEHFLCSIIV